MYVGTEVPTMVEKKFRPTFFKTMETSHKFHVILEWGLLCIIAGFFSFGCWRALAGSFDIASQYDFTIYYEAGRTLNTHSALYDTPGYIYPPAVAVIFRLFAYLPRSQANIVWYGANVLFLVTSVYLLCGIAGISNIFTGSMVFLLLFIAPPTVTTLILGQVNILLLLILSTIAYITVSEKRGVRSEMEIGVLLGIATIVKVYPVVFSLLLLTSRRVKAFFAMLATLLLLGGVGIVAGGGWQTTRYYVSEFLFTLSGSASAFPDNQSVLAIMKRLFEVQHFQVELFSTYRSITVFPVIHAPEAGLMFGYIMILCLIIVSLVFVLRFRTCQHRQEHFLIDFSLFIAMLLLVTPIVWDHYHVLLVIPFATLWRQRKLHPQLKRLIPYSLLLTCLLIVFQRYWRALTAVFVSPWLMMSGFLTAFFTWLSILRLKRTL